MQEPETCDLRSLRRQFIEAEDCGLDPRYRERLAGDGGEVGLAIAGFGV
jgi:hypothetical protein